MCTNPVPTEKGGRVRSEEVSAGRERALRGTDGGIEIDAG